MTLAVLQSNIALLSIDAEIFVGSADITSSFGEQAWRTDKSALLAPLWLISVPDVTWGLSLSLAIVLALWNSYPGYQFSSPLKNKHSKFEV